MRLCQCLGLVIAASVSGLSAGMLELPLFFPGANPDNVLSPPHSHWPDAVDEPVMLYSRLSGGWPGSVRHSGSDRKRASLCIESDTADLSQKTGFPGCLPLPEGFESVLVSIADERPDHQQAAWTLPAGKMVLPVNTTISETSEETSILLLPCDQEPCVVRDYEDRVNVLDFAEMTLSERVPGLRKGKTERSGRWFRPEIKMATLFTSGMTRMATSIPSANGSSSGGSRCIFKACWSFCTLSILAPLSLPGEAGTSGNTGKFAGQRTARKTSASSDSQPGKHDTSPMGMLRLYLQYNRSGPPNIIPAIKTISLSHHHQAGPLEKPLKMKSIDC